MLLAAIVLAGCSSGGQGGVNIGSGQSPDPVVLDFPVAYVKRPLPTGDEDLRELRTFQGGADVWLRDRAAPAATERNITAAVTGGQWDVRDLDVSFDGARLLFSMRAPRVAGPPRTSSPRTTSSTLVTTKTKGRCSTTGLSWKLPIPFS